MSGFQFGNTGGAGGFQLPNAANVSSAATGAGGLSFSSTPNAAKPLGTLGIPGGGVAKSTAASTLGPGGQGAAVSHFGNTPQPTQFAAPAFPSSGAGAIGLSSSASTGNTSLAGSSTGFKPAGASALLTPAPLGSISTPKPVSSASSSIATSSTGFSLGVPAASAPSLAFANKTSASQTSASTSLSVNKLPTTATIPATQKPSEPRMSYGQVEEKLNTWKREINKKVGEFKEWASNVNAWDCKLVGNTEKIITLHEEVERVKAQQKKLDQELKVISSQQAEIAEILQPLEAKIASDEYAQVSDDAREETFHLAESVQNRLDRTCEDLKTIIKRLNDSGNSDQQNADAMDPMLQITKILGAHVDTLSWVEQRTDTLDKRVQSLENSAQAQAAHLHHHRMY
eukprot:m.124899 g.124899  ORF g.124899 m.124899 type:complete len:399 (+) comp17306_c0_seq1:100-1296(+)